MARQLGAFNFSGSLEVKRTSPLDARTLVLTKAELIDKNTWKDSDGNCWLYNGIVVTVIDELGQYMLINYDPTDSSKADAYTVENNWKRIDAKGATSTTIIDSLTSTSTTAALSANLGKVLAGMISTVYKYKGSCTYAELAKKTDANVGDVWNVTTANGNIPAGTNYACYENSDKSKSWDALGGAVDLSGYATSDALQLVKTTADDNKELLKTISQLLNTTQTTLTEHTNDIGNLKTSLNTLTGDSSKVGSVKYIVNDALSWNEVADS